MASTALSTAREKVRVAHALKGLPGNSAAFADGRLSYSKVRALTRVAERCRHIRNTAPAAHAISRRAYERRSVSALRQRERGVMAITVELHQTIRPMAETMDVDTR